MVQSDHDLIINIANDMKYVREFIHNNTQEIAFLKKENQDRKDWQESADTKIKVYTGLAATIATVIGGMIVWMGDRIVDYWIKK